jgi:REP element-mobilizing transposase RayT
MSEYIHKSHNVTVLMYPLVFPAKYRRIVFDEQVDAVLKEVCLGIAERYQVKFLEIGTDKDHVHFLVQPVPSYSVTKLVTLGTYHGVSSRYLQEYLNEFCYRFNRREWEAQLPLRLLSACLTHTQIKLKMV